MKTLIEMSLNHYHRLLATCRESNREYEIMRNGLVTKCVRAGSDPHTVVIVCKSEEARMILDLAMRRYPVSIPRIREIPPVH